MSVGTARRYFQEAKWISDDDGGKLWGKPLYGSMVFVDHATRQAIFNEKPALAGVTEDQGLYVGKWPANMPIANAAVDFGGKKWTTIMWILIPPNRSNRAQLFAHEMWHRIQGDIGLAAQGGRNVHMDTFEGRLWIQVEAQALGRALLGPKTERSQALQDALTFRAYRQSKFNGAKKEEDIFEVNEALAQFTGISLRGDTAQDLQYWEGHQLANYRNRPSYATTFAYVVGAGYALTLELLDQEQQKHGGWRKALTVDSSLSDMVANQLGFKPDSSKDRVIERAKLYGYAEIKKTEEQKEQAIKERNEKYKKRLVDGPVLSFPISKLNASSRNDSLFSMGEFGLLYIVGTFKDEWGFLTITDGALLAKDNKTVFVQAPKSTNDFSGPGWSLQLNPGWKIVPGKRAGDFTVSVKRLNITPPKFI